LYTLPPELVTSFLKSYALFEEEAVDHDTENMIVNYYEVLNHLCALGEVEKMYIPPIIDSKAGVFGNQVLFEQKMCKDIGADQNKHILDMGCGRGRIAAHVAQYSGARVTGMNIDKSQVANAKENAIARNMEKRLSFVRASFNDPLPFEDATFDGLYQVQAFTYVADYTPTFKEMHRVLKPGAKVSILDWFSYDAYDSTNPEHVDLLDKVKPLIGAVKTPTVTEMCEALEKAGFRIIVNENASIDGVQYPLIDKADTYFKFGTVIIHGLVKIGILPHYFKILFDRFTQDGDAFIKADKMRLFTTCHQIVAQKI